MQTAPEAKATPGVLQCSKRCLGNARMKSPCPPSSMTAEMPLHVTSLVVHQRLAQFTEQSSLLFQGPFRSPDVRPRRWAKGMFLLGSYGALRSA